MSFLAVCFRFILGNIMTFIYGVVLCFVIVTKILLNPFKNPWATKLKLEPPAALSDPKYGVHKYIKANSVKLHYVESGDPSKPLMLFIHGFPEFWYSWRHQIVCFNKDYRCVAVDMRGYGDSERPEGIQHYKIELLADDMKDLINQLGCKKCIVVAHDWGGLVASQLRDTYPEVLDALVLLGSTSLNAWLRQLWTTGEQMLKSYYVYLFRIPILVELFLQMNNLECFDKIFEKSEYVTDQDIECYKYWFAKQTGLTPPLNYYRANFKYSWSENIHEEKVPFLFAHGENEKHLSRTLLDAMRRKYTYIETRIIEGCAHFLQQEEPVKVNKVIKEFLTKHHL